MVVLLMNIAAELGGFVGTAIPQIIDLLQHDDWYARVAGAEALSKLSEQGT
jgi:HEAT repeat protein